MVDKCIDCMTKGNAAEIDGLTVSSKNNLVSTFCSDYAGFINAMQAMMTQFRLIVRLI